MPSFSQRFGHEQLKASIQLTSMDADLRNSLWNALQNTYWDSARTSEILANYISLSDFLNKNLEAFCNVLWSDFFKTPLDTRSDNWGAVLQDLRKFFMTCTWHKAYDFIEFVAQNYPDTEMNQRFINRCNLYLEREISGYRFIGKQITPITDKEEIAAIEKANGVNLSSVKGHLDCSITMLSDRKSPDYRNCIKESISAVEALVKMITKSENGTLGELLKTLDTEPHRLHPALRDAFGKLYGYTSDKKGIRHALVGDTDPVTFEEAKFMLVACSAFVNYVIATLKD